MSFQAGSGEVKVVSLMLGSFFLKYIAKASITTAHTVVKVRKLNITVTPRIELQHVCGT